MNRIDEFINKTYESIKENSNKTDNLNKIFAELKNLCSANCMLLGLEGKIITDELFSGNALEITRNRSGECFLDSELNKELLNMEDIKFNIVFNISFDDEEYEIEEEDPNNSSIIDIDFGGGTNTEYVDEDEEYEEYDEFYACVIPVVMGLKRIATLFVYRQEKLDEENLPILKMTALVSALLLLEEAEEEDKNKDKNLEFVKASINTLTYSELEAAIEVFKELDSLEGQLVAGKVADKTGVTRSAIVNALRKLESAGILESHSLGVKGTYIKIKKPILLDELAKLR